MTIGQRITALRKEHRLSQEELGEQVGVSRQAIYKWESDASLPEIDKLIALSRLFGVSVGWLLGVEEAPSTAPEETGELTEAQLYRGPARAPSGQAKKMALSGCGSRRPGRAGDPGQSQRQTEPAEHPVSQPAKQHRHDPKQCQRPDRRHFQPGGRAIKKPEQPDRQL